METSKSLLAYEVGLAYGACADKSAGSAKRSSDVIGPDGKIKKAYPKLNAAQHPEEVLKDLQTR